MPPPKSCNGTWKLSGLKTRRTLLSKILSICTVLVQSLLEQQGGYHHLLISQYLGAYIVPLCAVGNELAFSSKDVAGGKEAPSSLVVQFLSCQHEARDLLLILHSNEVGLFCCTSSHYSTPIHTPP